VIFDDPWPHDRRLDPFRDAVWKLSRAGRVEAYLTCQVIRMRSFPFLWIKREWLWYQVNWLDGRRDEPEEDYGPTWYTVAEWEQGKFEYDGVDGTFDAEPIEGPGRDRLWRDLGPPM
jgi:hypothetical protein